jgi:hypothetical protein
MADTTTSTTDEQKPAETVEGQEPEQTSTEQGTEAGNKQAESSEEGTEQNAEGTEGDGEGEKSKLSHEDALAALAATRKSEAKYRTRLREAEEKLQNAKTPEEVEAAIAEIKTANATDAHALTVENVALKHKLPDDLSKVLADAAQGKTREELEAHATILAKYAPVEEGDPELSGGLDPSGNPKDFDAKAEAQKMRRQRRRGR